MKVYLFRHGQKDSSPSNDPDLTPTGHSQAQKLSDLIASGELLRGTHLVASPRLRAQNTLQPAAQLCHSPLQISSALDQRLPSESSEAFRDRIQHFLHSVEQKYGNDQVIYLCTHHDWIEEALSLIPADTDLLENRYWRWSPAQYMYFEIHKGIWRLLRFERIGAL